MNWTLFDYVVAGSLISALFISLLVIVRLRRSKGLKIALGVAVFVITALIWVEGAVGIF